MSKDSLDKLRALSVRHRGGRVCSVEKLLRRLPEDERKAIEQGLAETPEEAISRGLNPITNAGVARYIMDLLPGTKVAWQAVRNHRSKICACGRNDD